MTIYQGAYMLHFERAYEHARHYVGWSANLPYRLMHHEAGNGARLLQVVRANGITWSLARVWPGVGRDFERRLKQRGSGRRCPICRGVAMTPAQCFLAKGYFPAKALRGGVVHALDSGLQPMCRTAVALRPLDLTRTWDALFTMEASACRRCDRRVRVVLIAEGVA